MLTPTRLQHISRFSSPKLQIAKSRDHFNSRHWRLSTRCCNSDDDGTERRRNGDAATRREAILKGLAPVGVCLCPSCTRKRSEWYDKYFAYVLSRFSGQYQEVLIPYKEKLFAAIQNDHPVDILEIGVGTGLNFDFYKTRAPKARVIGLDPNPEMKTYAQESALESSLDNFEFVEAYAEKLPFEDNSFDYAVVTQVLCSVPDVKEALREIKRVVKPQGRFVFFEHVIGPPGSATRLAQIVFNPVQQIMADGCHLTRDTLNSIKSTPFTEVNAQEISIPEASFLAPHITGFATI